MHPSMLIIHSLENIDQAMRETRVVREIIISDEEAGNNNNDEDYNRCLNENNMNYVAHDIQDETWVNCQLICQ